MRYAVLITSLATVLLIAAACGDEESTPYIRQEFVRFQRPDSTGHNNWNAVHTGEGIRQAWPS